MTKKRRVVMTRCPLGTGTELLFRTGAIDRAFAALDAEVVLLQTLEEKEHHKHFTLESPLAFRDGGNVPPIWSRSRGTNIRVIGMNECVQSHAIIVGVDSPMQTPAELRGKRLSVPLFTEDIIDPMRAMVLRGYDTILKAFGLTASDVVLVDTRCDQRANRCPVDAQGQLIGNQAGARASDFVEHHVEEIRLLREGKIDAFFSHRALVGQIVEKGFGRVLLDIADTSLPKVNNIYPTVITVDQTFAEENRDIVVAYLFELLKIAGQAEREPWRFVDAAAGGQFGSTAEMLQRTRESEWNKKLRPSLAPELIRDLASQKSFLLQNGFIEKDFDIGEWIDPDYLREAEDRYRSCALRSGDIDQNT